MLSTNLRLLILGLAVFGAVAQQDGTRRVSVTSPDGSQTGGAEVSRDGSSGRAFASSTGRQSASSSVSLTVTGGPSTSGSFSTRGDREGVSGRVSSGGGGGGGGGGRRERREERREQRREEERDEERMTPIVPEPSRLGGSSGTVSSSSSSASSSSEGSTEGTVDESSAAGSGVVADGGAGTDETVEADETVEVVESSQSSEAGEEDVSEEGTEVSEKAEEAEEAVESPQLGGSVESEAVQPADKAPRGDFSSAVSTSGRSGATTSLISSSSSSSKRKKICVRTQSEFDQKLKEGYEVTLVRKVSGGNVEVLREHRTGSSYSRSRIVSSVIPQQIKKECDITEASLGIKKRTDGSFSSASSSSIISGSSSAATSGSISTGQPIEQGESPRKQGIFRLCSEENLKKFTGLKNICERLLERGHAQRRGDAFDIKYEFG